MYNQSVVEKNLKLFYAKEGWMPVYHSIGQVAEFKSYIDSITKSETNSKNTYIKVTRRLTTKQQQAIQRWIENEQILCSLDSSYFESRYAWVCNEKGEIFQFKNRESQEVFDRILAGFEKQQVSMEMLCLKARQQGITTKVALKFLGRMMFIGHTQAVMASVQAEKSELIARILNICYTNCPFWLIPSKTTSREKMMAFDNGSVLSIQSGSQPTGIAQGWTPTCIHISEIGDIPNPQKVIEEGLLRATHSSRNLFLVFEGTGNGNTGWLADKWRAAKEGWPLGQSRLMPMFLSWPLASDLYPEADWLKKFPIPQGWDPIKETRKHVRRCELYIRNTPYLADVCGEKWEMPRKQQWFWEFNYLEACKSHTQKIWLAQMPADDYEALTGKNDSIFEPDVIELATAESQKEYQSYAITGMSIDDGFEPEDGQIDYDEPRIRIEWDSHRGQHFEWTLIPLLPFNDAEERHTFDKLLVWHPPARGRDYSIGIDTADGLDKEDEDRTSMNVTLNVTGEEQDVQCAELVSKRINPAQAVGFAAAIGAWYSQRNPDTGHMGTKDQQGAKFCIEQRDRPGDDCQFQLKLMGFNNHHIMVRYDGKKVRENEGHKLGWYSNTWSIAILMNRFVESINGRWYKANSRWLIRECENLERHVVAGRTQIKHQTGKKDDRVRSAALAYFTRHAFDVLAERSAKRYALPSAALPPMDYGLPKLNAMSVGD